MKATQKLTLGSVAHTHTHAHTRTHARIHIGSICNMRKREKKIGREQSMEGMCTL